MAMNGIDISGWQEGIDLTPEGSALLARLARSDSHQQAEFISIFYGEDVTEEQARHAEEIFAAACPNAEVTLLAGGQPVYYYMISAE